MNDYAQNDGTRLYDHASDGAAQLLSSCQRDFRNRPYPVNLRITYLRNVLTVLASDGMSAEPRLKWMKMSLKAKK